MTMLRPYRIVLRRDGRAPEPVRVDYLGRDIIVHRIGGVSEIYRLVKLDLERRTGTARYLQPVTRPANSVDTVKAEG